MCALTAQQSSLGNMPNICSGFDGLIVAVLAGRVVGIKEELPSLAMAVVLLAVGVLGAYERGALMRVSVLSVFSSSKAKCAAHLLLETGSYCIARHSAMVSNHRCACVLVVVFRIGRLRFRIGRYKQPPAPYSAGAEGLVVQDTSMVIQPGSFGRAK